MAGLQSLSGSLAVAGETKSLQITRKRKRSVEPNGVPPGYDASEGGSSIGMREVLDGIETMLK
jgi:hypothetical protein